MIHKRGPTIYPNWGVVIPRKGASSCNDDVIGNAIGGAVADYTGDSLIGRPIRFRLKIKGATDESILRQSSRRVSVFHRAI
jgi:hypothetical protein